MGLQGLPGKLSTEHDDAMDMTANPQIPESVPLTEQSQIHRSHVGPDNHREFHLGKDVPRRIDPGSYLDQLDGLRLQSEHAPVGHVTADSAETSPRPQGLEQIVITPDQLVVGIPICVLVVTPVKKHASGSPVIVGHWGEIPMDQRRK